MKSVNKQERSDFVSFFWFPEAREKDIYGAICQNGRNKFKLKREALAKKHWREMHAYLGSSDKQDPF